MRAVFERVAVIAAAVFVTLILPAGAIGQPKKTCDGIAGLQCPASQFCESPAGRCSIVDRRGTCAAVPEICIQIYRPVCGCDGKTYSNDCTRRAAKVSKRADGICKS